LCLPIVQRTIHTSMKVEAPRKNSLRLKNFDYAARRCYFVTIVCDDRKNQFSNARFAAESINILLDLRRTLEIKLYAYVFMLNHFHGLISLGESGTSLGDVCGRFKSLTTRAFWRYGNGKLWQRQYFDHIVRNERDFCECIGYIRTNPIRKNLVDDWAKWPYYGEPDLREALG
jgi:REP element-mobilizing transposase RayT